ncbi:aspartyl-tRNA synthetase [Aspergillus japonicus CBS 114.51]|uniref:aspartate--tRNA ligase n=1 Tax=Aspergillus japonicus CBS 114.51 TaxID=1448312 RepID=A0A8T8WY32_ASPJA|nr:aspartyl-tRNA synthetase [Aspergillus japonicus CBS 114.51]RAH80302.1 aspartyl-tRNA synthetase [Aspergillus japonicus CBS 114.51]
MQSTSLRRSIALLQRASTRSCITAGSGRRAIQTVSSQANIPDFAFAFDIDGVLLRSSKPIPGAAESLALLKEQNIPFLLLTNGGGKHETERVAEISEKLKVPLDAELIVQSHSPFAELVHGTEGPGPLENKCVLVVGGEGDRCRQVAHQYGFKNVVTPGDIYMANPAVWPFRSFKDYYEKISQPLPNPKDPSDPSKGLKIDAIFVFNDPRDWALDAQIITDLLLSSQGVIGTLSEKNGRTDLPNHGYLQDGQPHLYFSNPDLWWAASYHLPRLGQGGFREALEGIWTAVTGGPDKGVKLKKTVIGKPYQGTYEFAERQLLRNRERMFGANVQPPLRNVYMIGDNPESDICGANSYRSGHGSKWHSILVRTGVYSGGEPTWTPTTIVDNVHRAVEWGIKTSHSATLDALIWFYRFVPLFSPHQPILIAPTPVIMADSELPTRPKPEETPAAAADAPAEGAEPTKSASKSAAKKAAKEKAKAEKAAARAAQEKAQAAAAEANDTAKGLYGQLPESEDVLPATRFSEITDEHYEKEITVVARVDNARVQSAKLAFLMLRQQGQKLQAVIAAAEPISRQMIKFTGGLNVNSIVQVTGIVKKPAVSISSATLSDHEVHIRKVYIISEAAQMLPMQVKDAERPPPETTEEGPQVDADGAPIVTLKTRLDNRVLDLQTETSQAITWISSGVAQLFTEYMIKSGSRWIFTPKLVGAATEGGSNVFEVKYFKRNAYLAQSPQLYKQMCIAGDMENVFEVAPVFRAEDSNTHRHLTEFTGLDFEKTFRAHYHEVLEFAEDLLVFILTEIKERYKDQIAIIQKSYPKAGDFKLPKDGKALRLNYMDGVALLKEAGVDVSEQERFENDFTTAMEKQLGQIIRDKYDTDFYVLDKFPMAVRPFYTKACPQDPRFSNSYDFFMRGEEIMSGAQRIHDIKELEESMVAKGLDPKSEGFEDYLAAFRQGCPPHAGGGLGLNRIVMFFLGLPNVRLTSLFPRDPQRLRP